MTHLHNYLSETSKLPKSKKSKSTPRQIQKLLHFTRQYGKQLPVQSMPASSSQMSASIPLLSLSWIIWTINSQKMPFLSQQKWCLKIRQNAQMTGRQESAGIMVMTRECMNKICDDVRVHKGIDFFDELSRGRCYEIRDKEVKACEISSPRLSFHLKLQIMLPCLGRYDHKTLFHQILIPKNDLKNQLTP